jgi:colanic acid biosynthesis glycosyl transferase WcaI
MRILYLSPYFWPEEIGSAPYCTDLALWLRQQGQDVRVVAFRPHYPSSERFLSWTDGSRDREEFEGIPISRVPIGGRRSAGFKDRLKNDLAFLLRVWRLAFRGEFKGTEAIIAYVPSTLTLYASFVVKRLTGARIVAVVHDIESGLAHSLGLTNGALSRLIVLAERFGLNRADHVVVLTEGMKEELRRIGCRRPVEVLPIWSAPPPVSAPPPEADTVLMYSGNFGKKQNLEQLLPLFQRLSRENGGVRIVLRGDGQEWKSFKTRIESAGIANAAFLPLAPQAELMASLQSANIHIVPQATNVANYSIPSKVFSIMAAGRPFICIAAKDSPLDELARRSGAGICVQPASDDVLYQAVVGLSDDPMRQRAMGEAGRDFVATHMNKQTIMQAYEALIRA